MTITPTMLSVTNTFAAIRALGMSVHRTDGEWLVNFSYGREATAYYTDDNQDAVDTARRMIADNTTHDMGPLYPRDVDDPLDL